MAFYSTDFRKSTASTEIDQVRRLGEVVENLVDDLRFQRQVELLYRLGPRAVGELLAEIGEQRACRTFIDRRLSAYAALDPQAVKTFGGDQFPTPPLYEAQPGVTSSTGGKP